MKVETMIYVYLFICLAMILFNIVTAIVLKRRDKKTERVSRGFYTEVKYQFLKIKEGLPCDERHKRYLRSKLRRVGNMVAFDRMLEGAYLEDADAVKLYLSELDGVFISLTVIYSGKGRIEAAYFPYIVKKYRLIANRTFPSITGILLSLLDEPGIYCRENVMQALYTTGDSDCVIEALKRIDRSGLFYHGKLITDGLLNFMGSIKELSDRIISEFDSFSPEMRVVLLNFIRFSSPDYCEYVFTILQNENEDDELRYSAIRYFAKYRYDAAYETLCRLSSVKDSDKWQYAAIASSALATYPGDTTVELLKHNLTCGNWYVRYNSADSLEKLGITYPELADVLDGEDRFAAEILQYKLKKGELERKEAAV